MQLNEKAILRTLIYADIFNYPLTKEEVWIYLISDRVFSKASFNNSLSKLLLRKTIFKKGEFISINPISLQNRNDSKHLLEDKLKKARDAAVLLSEIEGIEMIGLSGSLAIGSVREEEDIDFFIVTKGRYLWTVRMKCIEKLHRQGIRRSRKDKEAKDKVCLNMFAAYESLRFSEDIYTAHEIAQLVPLFSKGKTYEYFIKQNAWIDKFLPNFSVKEPFFRKESLPKKPNGLMYSHTFAKILEALQRIYMFPHMTTEKISGKILAFHPFDYKEFVLREYERKTKKYEAL